MSSDSNRTPRCSCGLSTGGLSDDGPTSPSRPCPFHGGEPHPHHPRHDTGASEADVP